MEAANVERGELLECGGGHVDAARGATCTTVRHGKGDGLAVCSRSELTVANGVRVGVGSSTTEGHRLDCEGGTGE